MINPYFDQERRKYPRVYASLPMQFRAIGDFDSLPRDTVIKDLSEGGMKFTSDKLVPVGSRLVVHLGLEPRSDGVRSLVKIVWAKKQHYSDNYELGCQFLNMENDVRSRIGRFIAHQPPA